MCYYDVTTFKKGWAIRLLTGNHPFSKKLLIVLIFIALAPNLLKAQGGCYGFGSNSVEEAKDVYASGNGPIYVAGKTAQNSGDAYLMKFREGSLQSEWVQSYGSSDKQESAEALTLYKGDLYVVGFTKKDGNKDILLLKIDTANGAVIQNKYIGNSDLDVANDVIVNNNGNMAITGRTKTTVGQNSIMTFVMEYTMSDTSFNVKKEFVYGTDNTNYGYALEQDSEGDYWVAGKEENNSGIGIIYQLKNDFSNNTPSDVIYQACVNDGSNFQGLNDVEVDSNKIVAAGTGKFQGTGLSAKTAFVMKVDHDAKNPSNADDPVSHIKEFGSGNTEKAKDLAIDSKEYTFSGKNGNDKMFSFQTDQGLDSINWAIESGGGSTDYGNAITKLDSNYFNVGKTQSSSYTNGSGNFYLMESNSGNNCCSQSQSLSMNSLNASNVLSNTLSNSSFAIDQSKLSNNVKSLSNPQISSPNGNFLDDKGCGALPVEFAGFHLTGKKKRHVQVAWQTASETNNDFFTVMRAFQDQSFQPVKRIQGQGTQITASNYHYMDQVPKAGTYYYKIRQTDFDGSISASNVKAVTIGNQSKFGFERIQVNESNLQISFDGIKSQDLVFEVFNSYSQRLGHRTLSASSGEQRVQIAIPRPSSQFYYLRVINTETGKQMASKKVFPKR